MIQFVISNRVFLIDVFTTLQLTYCNVQVFDDEDSTDEEETNCFESSSLENFCDACEREFTSSDQYQRHMQEHRVCGIDGCQFVAHSKIVEKHITMQHETGLFYRIAKTNTPEDVAKWIAERKKKYPTKENIEKRQKEQEEMIQRGERIQTPKDRFGRKTKNDTKPTKSDRLLNKRPRLLKKPKSAPNKQEPVSLLNDKSCWNGNLPPFPGTRELYASDIVDPIENIFDDDEWLPQTTVQPKIELNNALGALIGAYRSSDESDPEITVPKPEIKTVHLVQEQTKVENDEEAPEEVKIDRVIPGPSTEYREEPERKVKEKRNRFRKRKRKNSNSKPDVAENTLSNQRTIRRKITLLERLLAPDIQHERNVILQCVRYVIQKNFFDEVLEVLKCEEIVISDNNMEEIKEDKCLEDKTNSDLIDETVKIDEENLNKEDKNEETLKEQIIPTQLVKEDIAEVKLRDKLIPTSS